MGVSIVGDSLKEKEEMATEWCIADIIERLFMSSFHFFVVNHLFISRSI